MSKTFKSAVTSRTLTVEGFFNGAFSVVFSDDSSRDLMLQGDDAPALALAILEAAGVEARSIPSARIGTSEHLSDTAYELSTYIEKQQRATAEAKEQSELETCALEMLNALRKHYGKPERSWEDTHVEVREEFLVLARRARELGSR